MRIALGVEYNGSQFCGWQSQASGGAVQDAVERAVSAFVGAPTSVVCAGRTDAGVHALGQVIHLDTSVVRDASSWVRGVNAHLPHGVRMLWARVFEGELATLFHARFAAQSRRYQYLLLNHPVAPAIDSELRGWFHAPLAIAPMREAAALLMGTHDFSAFRSSECQAKSAVKTVTEITLDQQEPVLRMQIEANAFLHHMVRNIVGALVYVGAGRLSVAQFEDIFRSLDRRVAPPTFSASGLALVDIRYDSKFDLPRPSGRYVSVAQ
jgi:tRNA pseudouridine38-40 synthase